MLDYDKKFLLAAFDNLTFDGSSVRGFSQQAEVGPAPRHRLGVLLLAAADIFGPARSWCSGRSRSATARRTTPTCGAG